MIKHRFSIQLPAVDMSEGAPGLFLSEIDIPDLHSLVSTALKGLVPVSAHLKKIIHTALL